MPSVAVITDAFVGAARHMSAVLGAPGYPFVVIDHPISSAGFDTLSERAQRAALACQSLLCKR